MTDFALKQFVLIKKPTPKVSLMGERDEPPVEIAKELPVIDRNIKEIEDQAHD